MMMMMMMMMMVVVLVVVVVVMLMLSPFYSLGSLTNNFFLQGRVVQSWVKITQG